VQSPQRRTVTLDQTLAQLPSGKEQSAARSAGAGRGGQGTLAQSGRFHRLPFTCRGTTGSGKSEFLKSIVAALAAKLSPEQVRFMLIDPKRSPLTSAAQARTSSTRRPRSEIRLPLVHECEQQTVRRYQTLQKTPQNRRRPTRQRTSQPRPPHVLIIDEFANLMIDKEANKALTDLLKRIARCRAPPAFT